MLRARVIDAPCTGGGTGHPVARLSQAAQALTFGETYAESQPRRGTPMESERARGGAQGIVGRVRSLVASAGRFLRWVAEPETLPVHRRPAGEERVGVLAWLARAEELPPPPATAGTSDDGWWRWLSSGESLPEPPPPDRRSRTEVNGAS